MKFSITLYRTVCERALLKAFYALLYAQIRRLIQVHPSSAFLPSLYARLKTRQPRASNFPTSVQQRARIAASNKLMNHNQQTLQQGKNASASLWSSVRLHRGVKTQEFSFTKGRSAAAHCTKHAGILSRCKFLSRRSPAGLGSSSLRLSSYTYTQTYIYIDTHKGGGAT